MSAQRFSALFSVGIFNFTGLAWHDFLSVNKQRLLSDKNRLFQSACD